MIARTARRLGLGTIAIALLAGSAPLAAQDSNGEARLQKIEAEVRALQRRVFPGPDGRYFEPDISSAPVRASGAIDPSTSAVTDILARLDALEAQLQSQTALNEENAHALRLLSARVDALEGPAASAGDVAGALAGDNAGDASAGAVAADAASVAAETQTAPSAERLAGVQAITKPQTDDPGDDEYTYGFRLWDAGFYPEAQQQLAKFVEAYPDHWRSTYGRNLLGRAYLDDGKPRDAAPWFLRNYQADKNAARAGDSLLYLAESMIALDDTARACIALAEFGETYPALATGRLKDLYEANRGKVRCN